MSNKFTEEQYQKIIEAWQSENTYVHQTEAVIDYLIDDLNVDVTRMGDEAIALANPLTREWAHEQFVDEEKQYIWYSKKFCLHNGDFKNIRLFKEDCGVVISAMRTKTDITSELNYLTEKEVREWGYNPEMFDKEEVD